jgi:hypothetical protein
MKIRSIFFVAFYFAALTLVAQTPAYTFKVLVSKGRTEIKSGDAWQNIKVGASLKATDEVKLSENSYLGLIHVNGKPLEIREAKSFKVSDLVSRMSAGSSVLNKYTDFILSKEEEKKNRLSATGAVHRGPKDAINIYLAGMERADLFGDKLGLQWESKVSGPFEITFENLMGDQVAKFQTNDKNLMININEGNFKDEYNLKVKIVSKSKKGQGSQDYSIKKLRSSDREKYAALVSEMKASLEAGSALSSYIMAGFYEENLLINDALTSFQEAIKLAPDVQMYQDEYSAFLTRLGFKEKKEK